MKKTLAVLAVFAVVLLGFLGALAAVPHGHGSDLDHSNHKSCPVHQAGFHFFGFVLNACAALFAAHAWIFLRLESASFKRTELFQARRARSPPVPS